MLASKLGKENLNLPLPCGEDNKFSLLTFLPFEAYISILAKFTEKLLSTACYPV